MGWTRSILAVAVLVSGTGATALAAPPDAAASGDLTLEEIYRFDKGGSVYDLDFLPGGERALIGSDPTDRNLAIWNVAERKIERRIEQLGIWLAVSPVGKLAAVTDFTPNVKLVTVEGEGETRALPHGAFVISVAFSPDGKLLASGGLDNCVCIWDVETGKELHRLRGHEGGIGNLCFAPDGKWLVSASEDKTLRIWDPESGEEKSQIHQKERAWSVAVSPDGTQILSGSGGALLGNPPIDVVPIEKNPIRLWNAATGELIREMDGHSNLVCSLEFSPDGKYACSGSYDKSLRVWDLATGSQLARVDGDGWVCAARYSPDGRLILCGGGIRRVDRRWYQSPEERVRLFRVHRGDESAETDN